MNLGAFRKAMFCPNCGAENQSSQNYCRSCGLKLGEITQFVSEQFPTQEYAALQRRKERFEKLGLFSLSLFGFLGFAMLLVKVASYKIILFGPDVIFGAAFAAMILFGLLSVFFFNYPKLFMNFDKLNHRLSSPRATDLPPVDTAKLIDDRPFEPVPSITEDSTDLLTVKNKPRSFN
jgi:hypothetical protein